MSGDMLVHMMLQTTVAKLQSFAVDLLISELVSVSDNVDSSTSQDTRVDRIIRFVKVSRQITSKIHFPNYKLILFICT